MAKIIASGFFGVFSQTIFHVLQSDSNKYKTPSPKKRRKNLVDSRTEHSQHELNLLHKKFENFHKVFPTPVDNNSNKRNTSTLLVSKYHCYASPINSRIKRDVQSLQQPNKLKRSREISLSHDSIKQDPDYQEIPEDLLFNLPSTRM